MRSVTPVAAGPGFTIGAVTCNDDHTRWSAAESPDSYRVVLVRVGRFRRRTRAGVADLDRTVGYLAVPGEEERFAHPAGGDVCTAVSVRPALWRALAGDPPRPTVHVDARLDLEHRRLLRAAEGGDVEFAVAERLLRLAVGVVARAGAAPRPAASDPAGDRALVAAARAAIAEGHPAAAGLFPLAELLGASPYRLSRAFPRVLGVTLTRYRNGVRIARAMDRLEQGEPRLADLAADLGFADQAHLTRTVRAHLGHTPTELRRLLRRPPR